MLLVIDTWDICYSLYIIDVYARNAADYTHPRHLLIPLYLWCIRTCNATGHTHSRHLIFPLYLWCKWTRNATGHTHLRHLLFRLYLYCIRTQCRWSYMEHQQFSNIYKYIHA
jgi:hypothetical protein